MIVTESVLRDVLRLIVWFPFRWALNVMPVPVCLFIFRRLGDMNYLVSKQKRNQIKKSVSDLAVHRAAQGKSLNRVVRRIMQTHYLDRMLVFVFSKLNRQNIDKYISIEGIDLLEDALRKNRGCILVHSHFGPAQLSLCAFGYKGYSINQLGLRSSNNASYVGREVVLKKRLQIEESKIPAKMLYVNRFMRHVFRALHNNELVMMTGDGVGGNTFKGKYVTASFLGRKMRFPAGWLSLAQKTKAVVLPLSMYEEGHSKYRVVIRPPIKLDRVNENETAAGLGHINQFIQILESDVLQQPHMWHFWDEFHVGNLLVS